MKIIDDIFNLFSGHNEDMLTIDQPNFSTIEVEIGLLLRSPNEHQTKSKSFSINMGNRSFASNDRYMRDSFSTSVIVRNLYYANQ